MAAVATEPEVKKGEMKYIPLNRIRENPVALRPVNRATEKYTGLVDSIKVNGILNPINVREVNGENGDMVYSLVDGLHRFTAAGDAGLTEIPAMVMNRDDGDVLKAQIVANIHKVETKPVQYSKQLIRLLTLEPTMTEAELCRQLSKSPKWLSDRLGLGNLTEEIGKLVDEDKLNLSNAYVLAKLDKEEQANFVERAITDQPAVFLPAVQNRIKEIRDAKRQGKTPGEAVFKPSPHIRKMGELKQEFENPTLGPVLIKEAKIKTPEEAWALAIKWVLNMDPKSQEVQLKKEEERKAEEKRKAEKRKAERLEQKAKEAQEAVESMKAGQAG